MSIYTLYESMHGKTKKRYSIIPLNFILSRFTYRTWISLILGLIFVFIFVELLIFATQENKPRKLQRYQNNFELKHEKVYENRSIADKLYHETRILCWITTNPNNHKTKAIAVKETWGKRCNKLLFMSTQEDVELKTIVLNVEEDHDHLWGKTKAAFKYVYENHLDDADWFYKADDDTYAVVENMRHMLYPYSPDTPIYFGLRFNQAAKQGYMSGGPGYVLSKEALRRLVVEGLQNPKLCSNSTYGNEDWEMGICLENVNVLAGDSRDFLNSRGRFFAFKPEQHLVPDRASSWYWDYLYYKNDEGLDCCSDYAISFHYTEPNKMYVFDYLIYQLRPYGIVHLPEPLPARLKVNQTLPPPIVASETASTKSV